MDILYQIPSFIQRLYGGVVWRQYSDRKVAYLTFDDGPVPQVTPQVLDILAQEQVPATFFMVAQNAERYPELVQRIVAEGHRIGNHTYHHITGTKVDRYTYMNDIAQADKVLQPYACYTKEGIRLFRPPHGRMTFREKKAVIDAGYRIVLWDVMTHDWDQAYPASRIMDIVRRFTRNGSIINCHDSIKSAHQTIAALPNIIHFLKDEGYSLELL